MRISNLRQGEKDTRILNKRKLIIKNACDVADFYFWSNKFTNFFKTKNSLREKIKKCLRRSRLLILVKKLTNFFKLTFNLGQINLQTLFLNLDFPSKTTLKTFVAFQTFNFGRFRVWRWLFCWGVNRLLWVLNGTACSFKFNIRNF